jgi:hypothetical protein
MGGEIMETAELMKLNIAAFGNLFRRDPAKLSDQELLALDYNLHKAWAFKREGHRIHFWDDTWTFEDLLDLHQKVRDEMDNRSFKHTISDELDEQTLAIRKSRESKNNFEGYPNLVFTEDEVTKFIKRGNTDD